LRDSGYYIAPVSQTERDDVAADADAQLSVAYTPQMVEAVKHLQTEYGLKADGVIGVDTLKLMNTSSSDRARQLAINMERRRWLARTPPEARIDVNTAAALLVYYTHGSKAWQTRVVTGKPDAATPSLGTPLYQLVVNPAWHVPKGIGEKEILPKGAAYMAKENMYVKDGQIIQRPGANSALGLVKFDLKNDDAIYLHDTPAKRLFAETERHLSHGCVRVENPLVFARLLADNFGRRAQFEQALVSGETKYLSLGAEIPVRMMYHTAYVDDAGALTFRPDVYGWDEKLGEKLGLMPSTRRNYQPSSYEDIGP
jgi:murein L,D-transpeptidase YcbB/YkuD